MNEYVIVIKKICIHKEHDIVFMLFVNRISYYTARIVYTVLFFGGGYDNVQSG